MGRGPGIPDLVFRKWNRRLAPLAVQRDKVGSGFVLLRPTSCYRELTPSERRASHWVLRGQCVPEGIAAQVQAGLLWAQTAWQVSSREADRIAHDARAPSHFFTSLPFVFPLASTRLALEDGMRGVRHEGSRRSSEDVAAHLSSADIGLFQIPAPGTSHQ